MRVKVVLTGFYAGKTVDLNGKRFVNGELLVDGSNEQVESQLRYLARMYQAFPSGTPELKEAQERDKRAAAKKGQTNGTQRDLQAPPGQRSAAPVQGSVDGQAGSVQAPGNGGGAGPQRTPAAGSSVLEPGGGGHSNAGVHEEQVTKVRQAVRKLDPAVDGHWSAEGLPSLETLVALTGDQGVTRAVIEAAAPGWTREKAKEALDGDL